MSQQLTDHINYKFHLFGDNILYLAYIDDADIDIVKVKEIKDVGLKLVNHAPFYSIVNMKNIYGAMSNEAKGFVAKDKELFDLKICEAIIVNSLAMKILIKGYLMIFKPPTRTQIFNKVSHAVEWMKSCGAESGITELNEYLENKKELV